MHQNYFNIFIKKIIFLSCVSFLKAPPKNPFFRTNARKYVKNIKDKSSRFFLSTAKNILCVYKALQGVIVFFILLFARKCVYSKIC